MIRSLLMALLCMGPVVSYAEEPPAVPQAKMVPTPAQQALVALKEEKYEQALELLKPALKKGDAGAETLKGIMHYQGGLGVPKDYALARELFKKAAEKGHPMAQYYLGQIYDRGDGVNRSYQEAMKWYEKAASSKTPYVPAMRELAEMYATADLGKEPSVEDRANASKWMTQAAERGDAMAQYLIADWQRKGCNGLKKDPEQVYVWMSLISKHTDAPVAFKRKAYGWMGEAADSLTLEQLKAAREKADKIRARYTQQSNQDFIR